MKNNDKVGYFMNHGFFVKGQSLDIYLKTYESAYCLVLARLIQSTCEITVLYLLLTITDN